MKKIWAHEPGYASQVQQNKIILNYFILLHAPIFYFVKNKIKGFPLLSLVQ
jgi:hypothetical protein